ncbi:MAG: hypothetical protein IJO50_01165 [Clostridia bacterium]|nr:hypothetical protein [Clostridia bacterium]
MKRRLYFICIPILIITLVVCLCLTNDKPDIVNHDLAIDMAELLIKQKFGNYVDKDKELYLKAELKNGDWHICLDHMKYREEMQKIYGEDYVFIRDYGFDVVIRAKDGKIKKLSKW